MLRRIISVGIERRLYDIISVLCGLGIIKRRSDSLLWNQSILDDRAGKAFVFVSRQERKDHPNYYKGNNMMICLQHYLEETTLYASSVKMGDVWDVLYKTFQRSGMVLVVDIDSLKNVIAADVITPCRPHPQEMSMDPVRKMNDTIMECVSAVPGSSLACCDYPETVIVSANHVRAEVTREKEETKKKREKKTDDDEWKMPSKRPPSKKSQKKEASEDWMTHDAVSIVLPDQDIANLFEYTPLPQVQTTSPQRPNRFDEAASPSSIMNIPYIISPLRDDGYTLASPHHEVNLYPCVPSPQLGLFSPALRRMTPLRQDNDHPHEIVPPFLDTIPIALPVLPAIPLLPSNTDGAPPTQNKGFQISPSNNYNIGSSADCDAKDPQRSQN